MKQAQSWYEESLPAHERKMRGHYSTPPLLVERILDACGYLPTNGLTSLRVLDPACGSGNFLAGAAQRLLTSLLQQGHTHRECYAIMQRNLWGLDPDPVACCMAQMELQAAIGALAGTQRKAIPFHIHQVDGLAVPWEAYAGVDLFLANPPYLAAKNSDLSCYRSAQHSGQVDCYLFFLELALRIVRPGGWLGLVLPDAVLARVSATAERRRLLAEATIHQLWHLADVFPAYVGAVVLIAQKQPPPCLHAIAWQRQHWHSWQAAAQPHTVAQSLLAQQPHAELRYLLGDNQHSLPAQLSAHMHTSADGRPRAFVPLGELVTIRRGEEVGKESALLSKVQPHDAQRCYSVIRGGSEIHPYTLAPDQYWIAQQHIAKSLSRYTAPKLLVVKSTAYLQAALDVQGHVVLQTLYMLHMRSELGTLDELHFLLTLLNSRLLREYVYSLYTAYKWVQPQIEQHVLAQLPIPCAEVVEKKRLVERAKLLMEAASQMEAQDKQMPEYSLSVRSGDMMRGNRKTPNRLTYYQRRYQALYEEQEQDIQALYSAALHYVDKGVNVYG
jgi:SAM-dependent methyltransferase